MELSNPLTKDENYELIPQLEQALLELKVQSQISFWEELRDQLVNRNMKEIIEEKSLEYYVCHYYKGKQGRGFSWCFEIDKWWKQSKIALAIEIAPSIENDTNRIFYGFSLLQGREWVHPCNNDNSLAEKLPDNGYKRTNDWYIGWKYPKNKLRFPLEYREPDDKKFLFLLDEEKRGEAVQKLAEEIAEEVDEFKKNLVHCTVYSSQHRFAINSRENLPYGDCMKPVCGQLHCFLQD